MSLGHAWLKDLLGSGKSDYQQLDVVDNELRKAVVSVKEAREVAAAGTEAWLFAKMQYAVDEVRLRSFLSQSGSIGWPWLDSRSVDSPSLSLSLSLSLFSLSCLSLLSL